MNTSREATMHWILLILLLGIAMFLYRRVTKHKLLVDAVWNAYFAEQLLCSTELIRENPFTGKLKDAVVRVWRISGFPKYTVSTVQQSFNECDRIQQLNILAMAFDSLNQDPMIQQESWRHIRRPFIDLIGHEDILDFAHEKLKVKYGANIEIPERKLIMNEWGISDEPTDPMAEFIFSRLLASENTHSSFTKNQESITSNTQIKTQEILVTERTRKLNIASADPNWRLLVTAIPPNEFYNKLSTEVKKFLIDELVGDAIANIIKHGKILSTYSIDDVLEKIGIITATGITAKEANSLINKKILHIIGRNRELFEGISNYRANKTINKNNTMSTSLSGENILNKSVKCITTGLVKYAEKHYDATSPLAHEKIMREFIQNSADIVGISREDMDIAIAHQEAMNDFKKHIAAQNENKVLQKDNPSIDTGTKK